MQQVRCWKLLTLLLSIAYQDLAFQDDDWLEQFMCLAIMGHQFLTMDFIIQLLPTSQDMAFTLGLLSLAQR